jgi:tRNA(Ile)-lysidine synthase
MDLHKIIFRLESNRIIRSQPVVIGISGGPDSLALAHILHTAGFNIILAHLDHLIRPDSGTDADFISALGREWGVEVVARQADVPGLALRQKLSLEEAGRIARYQFLFETTRSMNGQAVLVGHNADDQVETMLMHFLRGAGLNGLKAMPLAGILPEWDEKIPLIRPLLYTWRDEIEAYCREYQLTPRIDLSNRENTFFRNRLRNDLIPYLQTYNPNIKAVLLRSNITLADDHSWLQNELDIVWKVLDPELHEDWVAFPQPSFLQFHAGAQRNLMRRMIASLIPYARDISFETVQACLSFVARPTRTNELALEQGLSIRLVENNVFLAREVENALEQQENVLQLEVHESVLTVPGQVNLLSGKHIFAEMLSAGAARSHPGFLSAGHAFLDAAKAGGDLQVRSLKPGDRFTPLGMDGKSMKLSDFWINTKVPRELRQRWPLVCQAGIILWVPGFRISDAARVTDSTRQVIHLWVE